MKMVKSAICRIKEDVTEQRQNENIMHRGCVCMIFHQPQSSGTASGNID
jgi:hypothetical protein